jgi:hypothetical protein
MEVVKRKVITILNDVNLNKSFSSAINLEWPPDEMIVRLISYSGTGNPATKNDGVGLIWCSATNCFIGTFNDPTTVAPLTCFKGNTLPYNTTWNFIIYDVTSYLASPPAVTTQFTGKLTIQLEFIEYDRKK